MTCIVYIRVSTADQVEHGDSRRMQRERAEAWAKSAGRTVDTVFEDVGVSGKVMSNRPAVAAAIELARELKCPLVVYSLSRLGRNLRELLKSMDDLQGAGADLVSLTESIDTTTAAGRMLFRMLAVLAEFERDLVVERVNAVLQAKRERGESSGVPPYGYKAVGGMLVECKEERIAVCEMVALRAGGSSYRGVAATLTDKGFRPRNGGTWNESSVRKILGRQG